MNFFGIQRHLLHVPWWDVFLLAIICLVPPIGALGSAVAMIGSGVAGIFWLFHRPRMDLPGQKAVILLYDLYFFYFFFNGWLQSDFVAAAEAMKKNVPILLFAMLVSYVPSRATWLTPARIGATATGAVLATVATVIFLDSLVTSPAIRDLAGLDTRLELFSTNPLPFAATFSTLGFLALLGAPHASRRQQILSTVAMFAALGTAAFWSDSRGALVTGLPLLLLALWYMRTTAKVLLALATVGVLVVALAAVIDPGTWSHLTESANRLVSGFGVMITNNDGLDRSVAFRADMWQAGIRAWLEAPLFGHGPQDRFAAAVPYFEHEIPVHHLHNFVITAAVAGGMVGVAIVVAILFLPVYLLSLYESNRDFKYFAFLILISTFGTGVTNLLYFHDFYTAFFGLLPILLLIVQANASRDKLVAG